MSNGKLVQRIGLLLLLAMAIAFPLLFSNPAVTTIAVFTILFAAAATGWNIFSGYTGYIALGHAAYFGVGAYALAILCQDWHIPGGYMPLLLVPVAGLIAAICAVPLGGIALRVRRHTFVVITIAMFFILQLLAYNLRGLTNGSTGMGLPIPTDWGGDFFNTPFYYVALAVLLFAIAISWWVRNSKYGLGLLAIRDDEDRALGLGVHVEVSKLAAFVISALIVGMVGAIWAYFVESIYPFSAFDATFDVAVTLMAFLGGLGTIAGPILGALLLEPTQQYFTLQFGQNYYLVIYGAMFLAVILLLPRGVIPTLAERWARFQIIRSQRMSEAPVGTSHDQSRSYGASEAEQAPLEEEQTREEGTPTMNQGATMSLLEVQDISKAFGGIHALDTCSISVEPGSITGLIGPNGSGKTTLFNVITGYERADTGQIRFGDQLITNAPPDRVFRLGIGRTFQLTRIFPRLTVLENMHVAAQRHNWKGLLSRWSATHEQQRVLELLDFVNLTKLKNVLAGNLSYGQKKLLEFALILIAEPRVLLLDEPAGGINPTMINYLTDRIRTLNQRGITFLVVEHNMEFVMELCDKVMVMHRGTKIAEGTPAEVRANPAVLEAYLGD